MEPFKLFKPEDFRNTFASDEVSIEAAAEVANCILNERGKRGYTCMGKILPDTICQTITKNNMDRDSHEALVFLREIETKEGCDHKFEIDIPPFKIRTKTPGQLGFDYCPKCGEKLSSHPE